MAKDNLFFKGVGTLNNRDVSGNGPCALLVVDNL